MFLIYITSGLFLGWSLGANDAANVFGTAVGTRMVSFRTAAIICSLFVILGAVVQGEGASDTLGALGAVNALAGSFTVALATGISVFWMTRSGLPVSTSQAIVGAIIGWNIYAGKPTDTAALGQITLSWLMSPVLGALFAMGIYLLIKEILLRSRIHLLKLDAYIRTALIIVGAFGSYSLGANNIANVMGVFVHSLNIPPFELGPFNLSGTSQLFLLGGIAIAVGVFTYSHKIMNTVGKDLYELTSEAAIAAVLSHALVLFIFSSSQMQTWMLALGLPAFPLVPVSSSHTIVGAIVGIGLLKNPRNLRFSVLARIAMGWVITPLAAGLLTFISLFFMDNVFQQVVAWP
ncbi:MAG: inorganic phosphate transporter [Lentimicrobiaceae bacterium]|nr:inorganic phosphate transporter [Lentimicrobiaceae bacterium]